MFPSFHLLINLAILKNDIPGLLMFFMIMPGNIPQTLRSKSHHVEVKRGGSIGIAKKNRGINKWEKNTMFSSCLIWFYEPCNFLSIRIKQLIWDKNVLENCDKRIPLSKKCYLSHLSRDNGEFVACLVVVWIHDSYMQIH